MQFVGYEATTDTPAALRVADEGAVTRVPLEPGAELAFSLGERHCAGTVEEGRHAPCSGADAPRCPRHASRWACARCTGDCDRPLPSCREEHAVYLAAFAPDVFKVGVTRTWRLETRLREQGADRGARIDTVADGRTARRVEADVATALTDRVRVPAKLAGLHEAVALDEWERLLEEYGADERFDLDYGLSLDAQPVPATLATGTVRGVQGRLLVVERGETTYGVDLRDLVGYEVTRGADGRPRQASLGAYG
ncbi:MAG: DUF2797 domain-containing protein [Halobacteriaceae archaeon]